MASLLAKFRIDYANLTMVHDVSAKPSAKTIKLFDKITQPFRVTASPSQDKRN
jgi:Solute carrier family 12